MRTTHVVAVALVIGGIAQFCGNRALPPSLTRADGLRVTVSPDNSPALLIALPEHTENAIEVIFPEHVTAKSHGSAEVEHLFLSRGAEPPPVWRRTARSFEYERDLPHAIHLLARATLEDDGVLFHYELTNGSDAPYDMIYAVTDPRLHAGLRDVRLERTYVHHAGGFDLLASETPERLTAPLDRWLPCRYLASYRWPVPSRLIDRRDDGITYYNKSRAVDEPFIATLSADRAWVVASFARDTGNVWSNPELTCQHVDPQAPLPPRGRVTLEVKMLVFRGTLDEARRKELQQRGALKNGPL